MADTQEEAPSAIQPAEEGDFRAASDPAACDGNMSTGMVHALPSSNTEWGPAIQVKPQSQLRSSHPLQQVMIR